MYAAPAGPLPRPPLLRHQTTCSSTNTRSFNFGKIFAHLVSLWENMSEKIYIVQRMLREKLLALHPNFVPYYNVAESYEPVICYNFQSPYLAAK